MSSIITPDTRALALVVPTPDAAQWSSADQTPDNFPMELPFAVENLYSARGGV